MNFLQLSAICHDKASTVAFLQQRLIIHTNRRCSNNHVMTLSLTDRRDRWRCDQVACKEEIAVRKGTWLQGSRLSYRQIVLFIYCLHTIYSPNCESFHSFRRAEFGGKHPAN